MLVLSRLNTDLNSPIMGCFCYNKGIVKPLILGVVATVLMAITRIPANTITIVATSKPVAPWTGYALLKHIASCESWGDPNKEPRQFRPDGSLLRGDPNPDDIGLAQINVPTWGKKAAALGFNIYTYSGNLAMAKWIFNNDPRHEENWSWSEGCWGNYR